VFAPSTGKFALIASYNLRIDIRDGGADSQNWAVEMRCMERSQNQVGAFTETRMIASNLRSVSQVRADRANAGQAMTLGGSESFIVDATAGEEFICEYKRVAFTISHHWTGHVSRVVGSGKVDLMDSAGGRTTVMMAKVVDDMSESPFFTRAQAAEEPSRNHQIANEGWQVVGSASVTAA
jgi:hypothetical protein